MDFLHKFTKKFKSRIKKELPEFYNDFKRYYFRSYSKRMCKDRRGEVNTNDRYSEFNYTTEIPTIEFRSSHLHGIKTWSDFFLYYKILVESAQETFNKEFRKEKSFGAETELKIEVDDTIDRSEEERITINGGQ